jgi:hypothetical protein
LRYAHKGAVIAADQVAIGPIVTAAKQLKEFWRIERGIVSLHWRLPSTRVSS